jgi:hypothetical protein
VGVPGALQFSQSLPPQIRKGLVVTNNQAFLSRDLGQHQAVILSWKLPRPRRRWQESPAQAIGQAAILQGYPVLCRETHVLLDELADAVVDGTRKQFMEGLTTVPLLVFDEFGIRKLPLNAGRGSAGHHAALRAGQHLAHFPIASWKTGGNCLATWPPSVPCSIVCSTRTLAVKCGPQLAHQGHHHCAGEGILTLDLRHGRKPASGVSIRGCRRRQWSNLDLIAERA